MKKISIVMAFVVGCAYGRFPEDADGDGYCHDYGECSDSTQPLDCNDSNSNVYPGALEICNDSDDDCDGLADAYEERCWDYEVGEWIYPELPDTGDTGDTAE